VRPLIPEQSIEYYVMYCLERGSCQASQIYNHLMSVKGGYKHEREQISGALQRLKRSGCVVYEDGKWLISS
jgi:hypothetical protein